MRSPRLPLRVHPRRALRHPALPERFACLPSGVDGRFAPDCGLTARARFRARRARGGGPSSIGRASGRHGTRSGTASAGRSRAQSPPRRSGAAGGGGRRARGRPARRPDPRIRSARASSASGEFWQGEAEQLGVGPIGDQVHQSAAPRAVRADAGLRVALPPVALAVVIETEPPDDHREPERELARAGADVGPEPPAVVLAQVAQHVGVPIHRAVGIAAEGPRHPGGSRRGVGADERRPGVVAGRP